MFNIADRAYVNLGLNRQDTKVVFGDCHFLINTIIRPRTHTHIHVCLYFQEGCPVIRIFNVNSSIISLAEK